MVALQAIHDWIDVPGEVISWDPAPATLAKIRQAPVSAVPVSYQQAQHLRAFTEHTAAGTDMARLNIPSWNIAGQCDRRAMTYVINAYFRRHDTYHSWFEQDDAGRIVRRTIENPAQLKFVPTEYGTMTATQLREHVLATPSPWEWDCFRFGVVQRADHFTIYVSVDHLHADAMFMGALFVEIHMMYVALVEGGAPLRLPEAGSYADYCVRQHEYTSALTIDSPEVMAWLDFADQNAGTLPQFPLPLGDFSVPCAGELLTVMLLDAEQGERFERLCLEAGARFSGGVLACGALTEHRFTLAPTYFVITPTTTRSTPAEFMTTGWFTGLVPIAVPISATSFSDMARAAQESFDSGIGLANVPFDRVLELAAGQQRVRKPSPGVPMLSYLDAGLPPLSSEIIAQWVGMNGKVYSDVGAAHQVGMWVNRVATGTTLTVAFPSNPIARESVTRYVDVMVAVFRDVLDGRGVAAACAVPAGAAAG
jgi:mycolipenoyl-CoA---2-(long-chain-fatty acyl)-trehalose mycolipenoyltransferase / long-chain-acyl-CoA---trehalose acyltransferase